jgi:hypothetical protein
MLPRRPYSPPPTGAQRQHGGDDTKSGFIEVIDRSHSKLSGTRWCVSAIKSATIQFGFPVRRIACMAR